MRVRLASKPYRCWPVGRFRLLPVTDPDLMPGGLYLNRLGDRRHPGERRPRRKGRHVIGCWLTVGDRNLSWVWPIEFVINRKWAREPRYARLIAAAERRHDRGQP